MSWDAFVYFAVVSLLLWLGGAFAAWKGCRRHTIILTAVGLLVFLIYILLMWISLERPPLRTMGETRLWYSFFLSVAGLLVYLRWEYRWILSFSTLLSAVFIAINLLRPEIHDKTLMPALQSPWFAPHVIVYMFAYALLGAATLMAAVKLMPVKWQQRLGGTALHGENEELDVLVRIGWVFLTMGMLFGALWAKEAWGHYWTWDPKETWAAVTWMSYLVYIHGEGRNRLRLVWLVFCFLLLQMCWWGINYLPSAQATSIHTYAT